MDVQEEALRRYPGRALINSISLESEKFEKLLPLAKKYGAMFVLLPLSDEGLPKNLNEKISIIEKIVEMCIRDRDRNDLKPSGRGLFHHAYHFVKRHADKPCNQL